jgi:serine/threonine protein kinase
VAYCILNCLLPELNNRASFIDFCQGLLNLNPIERWTPQQARQHPFITGEKFTKPWSVCIELNFLSSTSYRTESGSAIFAGSYFTTSTIGDTSYRSQTTVRRSGSFPAKRHEGVSRCRFIQSALGSASGLYCPSTGGIASK